MQPGSYNSCHQVHFAKISEEGNFYPFPPFIAKPLAYLFPTNAWVIFFLFEKKKEYTNEFLEFPKLNKLETNFYLGA